MSRPNLHAHHLIEADLTNTDRETFICIYHKGGASLSSFTNKHKETFIRRGRSKVCLVRNVVGLQHPPLISLCFSYSWVFYLLVQYEYDISFEPTDFDNGGSSPLQ